MSDYVEDYSQSTNSLKEMMQIDLEERVNAGRFFTPIDAFKDELDVVEHYFKNISVVSNVNRHEQTLAALLLSKANATRLSSNYQISKTPVTDNTASHHYVNDGSRGNFYGEGLRRLRSAGMI